MLRLDNLRKEFGDNVAVDGLTLHIERGEVFGLLGPNGAGKTTTISMIVGLLAPTGGSVQLEGVGSPSQAKTRRHIGVAPQTLALYEELSARENLRFFGRLYNLNGAALEGRVNELLEMTGLTDRADDRIKKYSGGMKRRINLAAAMVHQPQLLLLDEATAGVDPQSRNAIFDIITSLKEQGKTIIYTTHYMEEAQRLCDRVGIMDHGRLLALDTVHGLIGELGGNTQLTVEDGDGERHIQTDDPVAEIKRIIDEGELHGMRIEPPSLESVFLSLTGRSLRD